MEEFADSLGNSPALVRKHYAKWSQARQRRIDDLLRSANPSTHLYKKNGRFNLLRVFKAGGGFKSPLRAIAPY